MKIITTAILLLLITVDIGRSQQMSSPGQTIAVDVGHSPAFWGDPSNTMNFDENRVSRIKYLASQLKQNASNANARLIFLDDEITSEDLQNIGLLFIHVPTSPYSTPEVEAITNFLDNGGSIFIAMDVDRWSTLEQTNLNALIQPFGIQLGPDNPYTQVGGRTNKGEITIESLKIPYHGGRIVSGGTPFALTSGTEEIPFGVYKELDSGGKIIVMGDAMASLYMNSWQDVDDYQTQDFMQAVLQWLLE